MSRSLDDGRWRPDPVWALSAVLMLSAVGLLFAVLRGLGPVDPALTMSVALLTVVFAVTERVVVHVPFRGNAYSVTFGEIPLILGLALVDPVGLVLARMLGGGAVLLPQARRSPVKFALNMSHFALESCLAVVAYRLLLGDGHPTEPRGWMAAVLACMIIAALATGYVGLAINWHEKGANGPKWRHVLAGQSLGACANGSLALVTVVLLRYDARAVLLLAVVAVLLWVLYRAYSRLDANYARLELLQSFTRSVGSKLSTEEVLAAVLQQARTLLRAHQADVVLLSRDGGPPMLTSSRLGGPELPPRTTTLPTPSAWWEPALSGRPCGASAGGPGGGAERDGMAVPLQGAGDVFGVLLVLDRLEASTSFDREDLRLLETLGNHAAVSLQNGQLVDRLRDEVAEREHLAGHDGLTGLPNRRFFVTAVDRALAEVDGDRTVVMIMDLDGFKEVNDTLGHHTGDELLRVISRRLCATVGDRGLVARLGGDEFAILLPRVRGAAEGRAVAVALGKALEQPVAFDAMVLDIAGSIGLAVAPEHGSTCSQLLQRADIAMYAAKSSGAGVEFYERRADANSAWRLSLVADLRRAIEGGLLDVYFQPQVGLPSGRTVGAEALARWTHPEHGPVPPDEFVPIAERAGLIRLLTLHVVDRALAACASWRDSGHEIGVAVNLSVRNLLDLGLPAEVEALLRRHAVPAGLLTLELTESHIMRDPARCLRVLQLLDAAGVRLSIDDFGTGYSSLAYLKRLPVDEVKIDKGFVLGMANDPNDVAIVRSIVRLGHDLGLVVVAEGVEDTVSWHQLSRLGCDAAQGWHVSRALPAAEFLDWLESQTAPVLHRLHA